MSVFRNACFPKYQGVCECICTACSEEERPGSDMTSPDLLVLLVIPRVNPKSSMDKSKHPSSTRVARHRWCVCACVTDTPPGVWLCRMGLDLARFLRR